MLKYNFFVAKFGIPHAKPKFLKNGVLRPPENLCHPANQWKAGWTHVLRKKREKRRKIIIIFISYKFFLHFGSKVNYWRNMKLVHTKCKSWQSMIVVKCLFLAPILKADWQIFSFAPLVAAQFFLWCSRGSGERGSRADSNMGDTWHMGMVGHMDMGDTWYMGMVGQMDMGNRS